MTKKNSKKYLTTTGIRVLYVEDNPIDVDLTLNHFSIEAPEFEITVASTGKEFLKLVREKEYDILLMDHHLPDTLGIDLLKKLVSEKITTPVVMVTGLGDEELVVQSLRVGACDYISKDGNYLEHLPGILKRVIYEKKNKSNLTNRLAFEPIKVLYVETNPMDVEQTMAYVKNEMPLMEIVPVTNVDEAWRALEEIPDINLILCDLRLQGTNGLEFLHKLKLKNIDLPFVMITGKGGEEAALASLKLGAYDFIPKSKNYIEKLPGLLHTVFIRHKLDKANDGVKEDYKDLVDSIEEKVKDRTIELVREIEERKKAEEQGQALLIQWQTTFDGIRDAIFLLDNSGAIQRVNQNALVLFNTTKEEIIGCKCYEIVHHTTSHIEDCPVVKMQLSKQRETKLCQVDDKWFDITVDPILDDQKNVISAIHIISDVTEQKRSEDDLLQSEEKYAAFVKQSSEAICLFEVEHTPIDISFPVELQIDLLYENAIISECNNIFAVSHGYQKPEEMFGIKIGQVFPRLAKENVNYLKRFIQENHHISGIETKELNKDGSINYFLNSLIGYVENGKLIRIWGAKQDISRIKKVEEEIRLLNQELEHRVVERTAQLAMANKELESFNYSISHDLRAPLRAISGYSNLLKAECADCLDDEGRSFLASILANTERMENLIDDLLRLSKISIQEIKKSRINMNQMIEQVFLDLNGSKDADTVELIIHPLKQVNADSSLLKIALTNLLSNAIKFSSTREKQVIEVGCQTKGDEIIYSIKDNGVGFNMKYIGKLFDVFQRLHTTDEFEGTGIGLAIVQRIIHRHAGRIWAESEVEKGATFYFALPKKIGKR